MHILITRFSSLGDVIVQMGMVSALKNRYGNLIKLTFLTSGEFTKLVDGHPHVDQVVAFNRKDGLFDLFKLVGEINSKNKIDFILDLHGTLRSTMIRLRFWNIPRLSVDKRRLERQFLVKLKLNLFFKSEFQIERIIKDFDECLGLNYRRDELSDFIGINAKDESLSSTVSSFSSTDLPPVLNNKIQKRKYLVVVPTAAHIGKRWSITNFKQVIEKILDDEMFKDLSVVVIAGPEDNFCDELNAIKSERFYNLQGKTSLAESESLVKNAAFCLGNDTGMLHIAESQGVPVIMLFGPTAPEFGFIPT